jgi:hypothetical protein
MTATRAEHAALEVHHTDVVMVLSPIHTHIEHLASSLDEPVEASRRPNGSVLEARPPPAVFLLTARRGTI